MERIPPRWTLENEDMKQAGCCLTLGADFLFACVETHKSREVRVLRDAAFGQEDYKTKTDTTQIIYLRPPILTCRSLPFPWWVGGWVTLSKSDVVDLKAEFRRDNGINAWPDHRAALQCPWCAAQATPDDGSRYMMLYQTLCQLIVQPDKKEVRQAVRQMPRLACESCWTPRCARLTWHFGPTGPRGEKPIFPMDEALADTGLKYGDKALGCYELHTDWCVCGLFQAVGGDIVEQAMRRMGSSTDKKATRANRGQLMGRPRGTAEARKKVNERFGRCASCGVRGDDGKTVKLSRCAACHVVFYCSRECQKQHWPVHKAECKKKKAGAGDTRTKKKKEKQRRAGGS